MFDLSGRYYMREIIKLIDGGVFLFLFCGEMSCIVFFVFLLVFLIMLKYS